MHAGRGPLARSSTMRRFPHTLPFFFAVLLSILLTGSFLPGPVQRAFAGGPAPADDAGLPGDPGPSSSAANSSPSAPSPSAAAMEPPRGALDYVSTHAPAADELARRRAGGG